MRANLAVERHASKIYTRAMFQQFGYILYNVELIRWKRSRNTRHILQSIVKQKRERSGADAYKVTTRCADEGLGRSL